MPPSDPLMTVVELTSRPAQTPFDRRFERSTLRCINTCCVDTSFCVLTPTLNTHFGVLTLKQQAWAARSTARPHAGGIATRGTRSGCCVRVHRPPKAATTLHHALPTPRAPLAPLAPLTPIYSTWSGGFTVADPRSQFTKYMYLAEGIRIYSVYTVYIQGLYIQGKIQVNHNVSLL